MPTNEPPDPQQVRDVVDQIRKTRRTIAFLDGALTVLYPFCAVSTFIAFVSNLAAGHYGMAVLFGVITPIWVWLTIQFFKDKR